MPEIPIEKHKSTLICECMLFTYIYIKPFQDIKITYIINFDNDYKNIIRLYRYCANPSNYAFPDVQQRCIIISLKW